MLQKQTPIFSYGQPKPNRTTLLLDLDETLVQLQPLTVTSPQPTPRRDTSYWNVPQVLPCERFPTHSTYFVDVSSDGRDVGIIHLRPHLKPFLHFCFQHFNVAFWSTGAADYVRNIVSHLLCCVGKTTSDILFAWARSDYQAATDAKFVDVFTHKTVTYAKNQAVSYTAHKDLTFVFDRFPILSKDHTLLMDNLLTHQATNTYDCVLYVPPYCYLNTHDNVLVKLLNTMCKLQRRRSSSLTAVTSSPSSTSTTNGLLVTKAELLFVTRLSPTNNRVMYPAGYIHNKEQQRYQRDSTTIRKNQTVIVHHNGEYVIAKVQKCNTTKRVAQVRLLSRPTRVKRLTVNKSVTHKRPQTKTIFDVALDDVIDVENGIAYGCKYDSAD